MPVTAAELTAYGKSSIDLYLKNDPIDAINAERPLLKCLMDKKKETTSGKEYLVVQVRKGNDSNFQGFYGSDTVTYNRKDTLEQAKFDYSNFHDGFTLHEDDFIRNGVVVTEGGPGKQATSSEKETITNLLKEQIETLRLGFEESMDTTVHATSTTDLTAMIPGMDATGSGVGGLSEAITLDADANVAYGTLNRLSNTWWRNHAAVDLTTTAVTGNIETRMREAWRACTKYGGRPDKILVGAAFFDQYTDYMLKTYGQVNYAPVALKGVEGGEGGVYYQGVPLTWDPTFEALDDNSIETGSYSWTKRCYFINTKFLQLRPIKGQDMVSRTPPRVYNKYEYYWALTTRFYLFNSRPTAHAVLWIA